MKVLSGLRLHRQAFSSIFRKKIPIDRKYPGTMISEHDFHAALPVTPARPATLKRHVLEECRQSSAPRFPIEGLVSEKRNRKNTIILRRMISHGHEGQRTDRPHAEPRTHRCTAFTKFRLRDSRRTARREKQNSQAATLLRLRDRPGPPGTNL